MQELSLKEPLWLTIARAEVGTKEIVGPKNNPRVIEYAATTTLHAQDDETAWCSSFANWCMKQAGIEGTHKANARSWLTWGHGITAPVLGCILVFARGDNPSQGHVGFYAGQDEHGNYLVLGGNQRNMVCIEPRSTERLLGIRWPEMP